MSWTGPRLIPSATRLQRIFFWDPIVYLIEGPVFLLTGLQARADRVAVSVLDPRSVDRNRVDDTDHGRGALHLGFPTTYIPRWVSPALRERDPSPPWQAAFFPVLYRCARRGIARGRLGNSLCARQWPAISAKHELRAPGRIEGRQQAAGEGHQNCGLPADAIRHLRTRHQSRVQILPTYLTEGLDHMRQTARIKTELIEVECEFIYRLLCDGKITDEARRRIEYELDLQEASVANRGKDGG